MIVEQNGPPKQTGLTSKVEPIPADRITAPGAGDGAGITIVLLELGVDVAVDALTTEVVTAAGDDSIVAERVGAFLRRGE